MARRKPRPEEEQRELTRKEHRLRARDRKRNNRIMLGVGIALALAAIVVIAGLVTQFIVLPNSTVAKVGATQLVTKEFWKRTFLEQNRMQNQLVRLTQLEQQFGGQGFFTTQISQLQGTLSSPFTLGVQVLDQMVREEVVRQKAAERGITVSEQEIDDAIREEVAGQRGNVTAPQATATVEAAAKATVTAESWTPTPTATVDASGAVTATATPIPTPVPPPTSTILTDEQYTEGLKELEDNLQSIAKMSLVEYRKIVAARLLDKKLSDAVGAEKVAATEEEQVHARHILLNITDTVTSTNEISSTNGITTAITTGTELTPTQLAPTEGLTRTSDVNATGEITSESTSAATPSTEETAEEITSTEAATAAATATAVPTATGVAAGEEITITNPVTAGANLTNTAAVSETGTVTPEKRNEAQTLTLALELRQRLEDGEDFAALAEEYSSDTTSAANGGDLGWFGKGKMVAPFEQAAFSLNPGEISQPIRSDFGYHIIEVLEKDPNHPKEEDALTQERAQAYDTWIQEQITATPVERSDLVSKLPSDLKPVLPQGAPAPDNSAPPLPDTSDAP